MIYMFNFLRRPFDAVRHRKKAPPLRFGWIFRPAYAVRKSRNTWSIPAFPNL